MTLEEKKTIRLIFLKTLYEDSNGNTLDFVDMYELGEKLGLTSDVAYQTAQYLDGEGLLEIRTLDGGVTITHSGVIEIEEAIENPGEKTEHFPPINIITIHSMENSVIQQGSPGSVQKVNYGTTELDKVKAILAELEKRMDQINLSANDNQEMLQEIQTIKAQLGSPKPKSVIISESLKTIRELLLNVTGNVYTPVIVEWITSLLRSSS